MNLAKLFETQRKLDERIIEEKGLHGQDLLDKKILALQVELGELANEWEMFKFWKENPEPKTNDFKVVPNEEGRPTIVVSNPLLEEYVDCLHFILSIGLEMGYSFNKIAKQKSRTITLQFNDLFHTTAILFESIQGDWDELEKQENYDELISSLLGLGDMLGLTWEQIEQAYFEKNAENHRRQEAGY